MKYTATIIIFGLLLLLFAIKGCLLAYDTFVDHKSKCFDCERQIMQRCGPNYVWKAQPAKSFDAEVEGVSIMGGDPAGGFLAKTLKYY